jgi:hypothetical protein
MIAKDRQDRDRREGRDRAARFVIALKFGFGVGNVALKSGRACLANSPAASMGDCWSGNAVPNLGPNRNTVQFTSSLWRKALASALGGFTPARTSL